MGSNSQRSLFDEGLYASNNSLGIEVTIEPQLRLASAINGISHLAEVNEPYMISTSVSVGEESKMNEPIV